MCPQAAYLDGEGSSCPRRDMMLINVLIPEKQIPPGGEVRGRDRLSGQDMAKEAKVTHPSSSCTCGGPSCLRTSAGGCRSWRGSCGRDRDSCRSWGGDWGESWRAGGEKEGVVQHFSTSFRKLSRHSDTRSLFKLDEAEPWFTVLLELYFLPSISRCSSGECFLTASQQNPHVQADNLCTVFIHTQL